MAALDLHIHSALSPCGGAEMAPPAVLLTAERRGLATIGIVDHSTAGNAEAFLNAAQAFDVNVLVGLEIESAEGVHLLALFDNSKAARSMEQVVAAHQPDACNRRDVVGAQCLLDEYGEVLGEEDRLLIAAARLTVEQLAAETHERGGLSVAAHIDRRSNGLLPTLGFIPPRLQVDLFEISPHLSPEEACRRWPELVGRPLMRGSDAHYLDEIGRAPTLVPQALARPSEPLRDWAKQIAAAVITRGVSGL